MKYIFSSLSKPSNWRCVAVDSPISSNLYGSNNSNPIDLAKVNAVTHKGGARE
jgi:hypothetical protein